MNLVKRIGIVTALGLIAAAGPVSARGNRGGGAPGPTGEPATHAGEVLGFQVEPGAPAELRIRDASGVEETFFLGPFWYVERTDFEARVGDHVEVDTIACDGCARGLLVLAVRNLDMERTLALRSEDGLPLWRRGPHGGRRGMYGPCAGDPADCPHRGHADCPYRTN